MNDNVSEQIPITLSREDLYELAWSKPMSELAKDFGISDVALAKRCRRLGVPVPGRGYWARIDAGQQPYRSKLPEREEQWSDHNALTVPLSASNDSKEESSNRSAEESQDGVWLAERFAFEQRPENSIAIEQPPSRWDPVVRIHRDKLRAEVKEVLASKVAHERHEKLPEWRKQRDWNHDGWKWQRMMDNGRRLIDYHKPRAFRVTMETLERALAIANAIATAGKARGFTLVDDEKEGRITVAGHAAEVQFRLTEQLETKVRKSKWRKEETEKYKVPTGRLRITVTDGWREGPIFEDKEIVRLETLLNRLFGAIYKLVVKQWKDARARQVCEEQERLAELRRVEKAKIRAEEERKAEIERRKREALFAEGRRWEEAQRIRAYVAQVQETTVEKRGGNGVSALEVARSTDGWLEWALAVANELDPTASRRISVKAGDGRRVSDPEVGDPSNLDAN